MSVGKLWTLERAVSWPLLLVLGASAIAYSYHQRWLAESQVAGQVLQAQSEAHRIQSEVILFTEHVIPAGAPFASIMKSLGIDSSMAGIDKYCKDLSPVDWRWQSWFQATGGPAAGRS